MNAASSNIDRLLELLSDRALFGLGADEERELEQLSLRDPDVELDAMDRIAAMLELSRLSGPVELPAELQQKILLKMPAAARDAVATSAAVSRRSWLGQVATWGGWATAAALLIALLIPNRAPVVVELTSAEARTRLMAAASDLLEVPWTATEDATALGAKGDIVWSNAAQEGYMRFAGLASNNPTQYQYQLWIFDAAQDDKYPIDGGVFDIPAGSKEVIIPIAAKLDVTRPVMFAITVEKPGGVVVSSRERIPLLAQWDS